MTKKYWKFILYVRVFEDGFSTDDFTPSNYKFSSLTKAKKHALDLNPKDFFIENIDLQIVYRFNGTIWRKTNV